MWITGSEHSMNGISTCTHAHPPMTTYDVNGSIAHRLKPSLSVSCTMYSAKYNFMTFEKVCEYSDGQNKVDCTCRCDIQCFSVEVIDRSLVPIDHYLIFRARYSWPCLGLHPAAFWHIMYFWFYGWRHTCSFACHVTIETVDTIATSDVPASLCAG